MGCELQLGSRRRWRRNPRPASVATFPSRCPGPAGPVLPTPGVAPRGPERGGVRAPAAGRVLVRHGRVSEPPQHGRAGGSTGRAETGATPGVVTLFFGVLSASPRGVATSPCIRRYRQSVGGTVAAFDKMTPTEKPEQRRDVLKSNRLAARAPDNAGRGADRSLRIAKKRGASSLQGKGAA